MTGSNLSVLFENNLFRLQYIVVTSNVPDKNYCLMQSCMLFLVLFGYLLYYSSSKVISRVLIKK
jgi:hypothetical protein